MNYNMNYLYICLLFLIIIYIVNNINNDKMHNVDTVNNIYIFYHIYCNDQTMDIIRDTINKIIWSKLYKRCDKIYCFLTGDETIINTCSNYINKCGKKFIIAAIGVNDTSYERFTLLKIKNYINNDDKLLYIHSKGITKNNDEQKKNCNNWRYLMEYFLIQNWEECITKLDDYDTIGVNVIENLHYSGNFWWTRGSYFLTLPDTIPDYYTAPEDYILINKPKYLSLYQSGFQGMGHYTNEYPMLNYIDK